MDKGRLETVNVNKIQVENRIRTDAGDLTELKEDIKINGVINPILLTDNYKLIAGYRRLCAQKELGYAEVVARVIPVRGAIHELKLEISENENRKDFTFSERMKYAKLLKDEYTAEARANSLANLKRGGETPSAKSFAAGRVSGRVAEETGMGSSRTYEKSEYVYDNADDEMIAALDGKRLSVNKAYRILRGRAERAEAENEKLAAILKKQADDFDKERADAARRIEKQARRAEEAEANLNVVKRLGDPELVREVDKWKGLCSAKDGEIGALTDALNAETKKTGALLRAQGYAEAIEEERDALLEKVAKMEARKDSFGDIEDMTELIIMIKFRLKGILKRMEERNAGAFKAAGEEIASLIEQINAVR